LGWAIHLSATIGDALIYWNLRLKPKTLELKKPGTLNPI
jgi:hypothetical protein